LAGRGIGGTPQPGSRAVGDPDHVDRFGKRLPCAVVQFHHAAEEDTMADKHTWAQEDKWWEQNFSSRPYASGRTYSDYRPAYQYGYESGRHNMGRNWNDVESDLRTGWDKYEGRGQSTWDHVKDAVRDAWDRVTGQHDVDADRMSESNVGRTSRNF
jgi:hypothetical protein